MTIWAALQQVAETHSDHPTAEATNNCFKAIAVELWKQKTTPLVVNCMDLTAEIQICDERFNTAIDTTEAEHIIDSCNDTLLQLSKKVRKANVDMSASIRDLLDQHDLPYASPDFDDITDLFQTPAELQKASMAYQKMVERYHIMLQQAA